MERQDDLQTGGLYILQDPDLFCFSTDAVLLADFAALKPEERVIDLGSGCGILPLLMYAREPSCTFTAVELQPQLYDLLKKSIHLNRLERFIFPVLGDIKAGGDWLSPPYDVCVCNPPYEKVRQGQPRQAKTHDIARKEIAVTLREICSCAAKALRSGGRFYLCLRPDRLAEACFLLKSVRLEPKLLRTVHAKTDREARLCLLLARKDGHEGMRIAPPLFLYDTDGTESAELKKIYRRGEECGK